MKVAPAIDFAQVHLIGNRLIGQLNALREVAPLFWNEAEQSWVVSGHAEVLACFRGDVPLSAERFRMLNFLFPDADDREKLMGNFLRYFRTFLINVDRPYQQRLRMLMAPAFAKKSVEPYRPAAVEVIHQVLGTIEGRRDIEFMSVVARPITGLNILRMMGFEDEQALLPRLQRWAYLAVAAGSGIPTREIMAQSDAAFVEMAEAFLPIIEQRRTKPTGDFASRLVTAEINGDRMTDDEIVGNLILILLAGHDTTLNTMTLSVEALSHDPAARQHMRDHPENMLNAVLELSRFIAMSTEQTRIVAQDFEWQGQQLRQGQFVHIMTAAANRDPRVFEEPERLDLSRDQMQNVAFGPGIHHCIGHLFAKMQLTEFFAEFLQRYDSWQVTAPLEFAPGLTFRGTTKLPLELQPRHVEAQRSYANVL